MPDATAFNSALALIQSGNALQNPVGGLMDTLISRIVGITVPSSSLGPSDPGYQGAGYTSELQTNLQNALTSAGASVTQFKTHTENFIANFPSEMGKLAAGFDLDNQKAMQYGADICQTANRYMGSVMGGGYYYGNGMNSVLSRLVYNLARGFLGAEAAGLIADLLFYGGKMDAMRLAELAMRSGLLNRLGLAGALGGYGGYLNHPCLNVVMRNVGTPQFLGYMNTMYPNAAAKPNRSSIDWGTANHGQLYPSEYDIP